MKKKDDLEMEQRSKRDNAFFGAILFVITVFLLTIALLAASSGRAEAWQDYSTSESEYLNNCIADVVYRYSQHLDTHSGYAVYLAITVDVGWCGYQLTYPDKDREDYYDHLDRLALEMERENSVVIPFTFHNF